MRLKETVALVTGAGRGIGKAIAVSMAREGASVVLNSRTKRDLERVRKEIKSAGGTADMFPADITKDAEVEEMFRWIGETFGRLDVLVNNAGIGTFAPVRELAASDFDAMWDLNVRALFQCTRLALVPMERQKKGMIVNISSLAGKNAFVGGAGYAATKWALIGFSRCLMLEEREHNIRVVTICPGSVDTTFSHHDPARSNKILSATDVADAVLLALTMPERAMVSEIDIRPTNPK